MFEIATTPAAGIVFGAPGRWFALLVLTWLLVGEPWAGRLTFGRFLAALNAGVPGVRMRVYRLWSAMLWGYALIVLTFAAMTPGFGFDRLGLRWPRNNLATSGIASSFAVGLLVGVGVAVVAGIAAAMLSRKRQQQPGGSPAAANAKVLALLPRTAEERRGFAMLSITAGITEEIVWRGFLLAAMVALLPPMPLLAYVGAGALVFGLAHAYQGPAGIVVTGFAGAFLMAIYLVTGSLLLPMVLHALMDLNGLRVPVHEVPEPA